MRPLFKKKAEELRRVDVKKIPKYYLGALATAGAAARGLYGLGKNMAVPAYRYLAPKFSQYVTQPTTKFMARPGAQTTLAGLEGYALGEGAGEIAEGVKTGDYGRALTGASYAIPGAAYLPSTARKSGIKALRKFGEKVGDPATQLGQAIIKNPGKTTIGTIGAGGLGMFMSPSEAQANVPPQMTAEEYRKSVEDRLIYERPSEAESLMEMKERATDTAKLSEAEAFMRGMKEQGGKKAMGLKNPVGDYEIGMNKDLPTANKVIDIAKQLGIDLKNLNKVTDKDLKNIATESNVDIKDVYRLTGKKQPGITPPPINPVETVKKESENVGNLSAGEIKNLVDRRKRDLESSKKASSLSAGFADFKNSLNEMTGGNDNLNHLVAMKAASKLLTGKSTKTGMAGFLEIGGEALGSSADVMLQLAMAQKTQDMNLAQAYLKMKAKEGEKKLPGFETGDKTFRIPDDTSPDGFRNIKGMKGKDGKRYILDTAGNVIPAPAEMVGYERNVNDKDISYYGNQLEENKRGMEMIQYVINNIEKPGTTPGAAAVGTIAEDVIGAFDAFSSTDIGANQSTYDAQIRAAMERNESVPVQKQLIRDYDKKLEEIQATTKMKAIDANGNEVEVETTAGAKKVYNWLNDNNMLVQKGRPTEENLKKYAKFALIEQRMKYIVANANKDKDRLTQKDIENAAKNTDIIGIVKSPRGVRIKYEALAEEFNNKAVSFVKSYKNAGATDDMIEYYKTVPGVQKYYKQWEERKKTNAKVDTKQKRNNVLSTITIGAK